MSPFITPQYLEPIFIEPTATHWQPPRQPPRQPLRQPPRQPLRQPLRQPQPLEEPQPQLIIHNITISNRNHNRERVNRSDSTGPLLITWGALYLWIAFLNRNEPPHCA